jgi:hypothetical protein
MARHFYGFSDARASRVKKRKDRICVCGQKIEDSRWNSRLCRACDRRLKEKQAAESRARWR